MRQINLREFRFNSCDQRTPEFMFVALIFALNISMIQLSLPT